MNIANNALVSTKYKNAINKLFDKHVPDDEILYVGIKGTHKEYLLCTNKQVYIIKKGFMTGHTFGNGLFKIGYNNITSVEIC